MAAIAEAERRYGLPTNLLRALIWAESRFNPMAVSPAGAAGLAQLMPATARELGVTIIAYTPLESGLLTGKYHKAADPQSGALVWRKWMIRRNLERTRSLVEAMETIGQRYDATVAQVALNWLINYSGDTVVTIPGATKVHQAQQNAGAMAFRLTDDEMSQLDELSQLA